MKRFCSLLLAFALLVTVTAPTAAAVDDFIVIPWGDDQTVTQPETPSTPSAPVVIPTIPLDPGNTVAPVTPSTPAAPTTPAAPAKTYKATRSNMMISVDGALVEPAGYAIEGYTYYKLRDVAYLMIGKPCTFAVGWDQPTYSVTMTTGEDYTPAGGELKKESASTATAKTGDCNLLLDGDEIELDGYLINSNNYFKLRDIGDALGFTVGYDDATRTILIDTTPKPEPEPEPEEPDEEEPEEEPEIDLFAERSAHLDGELKIVIDPGHGGSDAGTIGTASIDFEGPVGEVLTGDQILEKDFNLAVALRLQELLEEEDVEVVMIREDDETVSSSDRVDLLKEYGADADMIFSVHHNAVNGKTAGAELLAQVYFEDGGDGADFAEIYEEKIEDIGHTMRRTVYKKNDSGKDYYFVLRAAANIGCLAFISEFCFLDNPEDQLWVFGNDALDVEAEMLFDCIMEYFEDHEY
ncbi:MAG: N-acetylmuramoyl-L-alanine amidase [Butyricicoccus sp.]|nr:N-acetylmuramoyl-L-alanine amidase [Butyricicoccus sp.]